MHRARLSSLENAGLLAAKRRKSRLPAGDFDGRADAKPGEFCRGRDLIWSLRENRRIFGEDGDGGAAPGLPDYALFLLV